jgi:Lrp/AsnC family leucine-responsive transcriptional regulator
MLRGVQPSSLLTSGKPYKEESRAPAVRGFATPVIAAGVPTRDAAACQVPPGSQRISDNKGVYCPPPSCYRAGMINDPSTLPRNGGPATQTVDGPTATAGLDEMDRQILRILQQDARTSNAEIARRVGLTSSAIFQRIRKLEESGTIRGYTTLTDARRLGYGLVAFIMVRTGESVRTNDTIEPLLGIREVQEIHRVVGEDCFLVKVRVADTDALAHLLDDRIQPIPSVASTRTTIVLQTARETLDLPI